MLSRRGASPSGDGVKRGFLQLSVQVEIGDDGHARVEPLPFARGGNSSAAANGVNLLRLAMLAGMAIENMLKGLILQGTARDARLELMSKKKLITHDLVTLATRAGVELADFEQELLARLSRFIVWAGRYPVALTATDTENADRDLTSDDYPMLVELSQRLLDLHLKTAER